MKFNDEAIRTFVIEDESDTVQDIEDIVNRYYDLGTVVDVHKLSIGNTNFNYFVTLEKDGAQTKYFGQLFSTSKSLTDLKYELSLREYYDKHNRSEMKCGQVFATKDGGYTVRCVCSEIDRERYFCLFTFLEGKSWERDTWAYGKIWKELIRGCAKGMARYHVGAYGFVPPAECGEKMSYAEELVNYRKVFTEIFEQRRKESDYEYYDYFGEYQPRLLELLDKYTANYMAAKDELPTCICHIDTSPQNYLLDEDFDPVGICDLDISQERPRLYDIGWFINEGLCSFDPEKDTNSIDVDKIATLLDAYDEAIEEMGDPAPGKLTPKERDLVMDIFGLASIHCGFYYIWDYILNDNSTNTVEYYKFWGDWTRTALEFAEEHDDEFRSRLKGE